MRKPDVLYHGSPERDITILEPRAHTTRDPQEGQVVFACRDLAYATMFMVRTDDSWTVKGSSAKGPSSRSAITAAVFISFQAIASHAIRTKAWVSWSGLADSR